MMKLSAFAFASLVSLSFLTTETGETKESMESLMGIESDSTLLLQTESQLHGCWTNGDFQFRYNKHTKVGGQYRSKIKSSAPIFNLVQNGENIFMVWIELTGGEYYSRIVSLNKNFLVVETEDGNRLTYRRNKDCR